MKQNISYTHFQAEEPVSRTSLNNQTAVITGAGQGIGRSIAEQYADAGANLALVDIQVEKIEDIAQKTEKKFDISANSYQCNVANRKEVKNTFNKINRNFKDFSIVVNNAGYATKEPTLVERKYIEAVNKDGVQYCTEIAAEYMDGGVIINMGSRWGMEDVDIKGDEKYSATKKWVIDYSPILEGDLRLNVISPAYVETPMNDEFSKEAKKELLGSQPSGCDYSWEEPLYPEQVAQVALDIALTNVDRRNITVEPSDFS